MAGSFAPVNTGMLKSLASGTLSWLHLFFPPLWIAVPGILLLLFYKFYQQF